MVHNVIVPLTMHTVWSSTTAWSNLLIIHACLFVHVTSGMVNWRWWSTLCRTPRWTSMRQIVGVVLHWTLLESKFIHDNLFFHTHLSQYSQSCFTIKFCQLKCMSVCSGEAYKPQVCKLQFTIPPAYIVLCKIFWFGFWCIAKDQSTVILLNN